MAIAITLTAITNQKYELHLKPAFGIYRLSGFQYAPDKVQEWADSMKVKGFSKSMIQNTLTCLQGAMNYAILPLKYIQANPCVAVKSVRCLWT